MLVKAKVPAAAKANEEKPKGLVLFEPKPPTPKLLKAFGHIGKGDLIGKLMVQSSHFFTQTSWGSLMWLLFVLRELAANLQ